MYKNCNIDFTVYIYIYIYTHTHTHTKFNKVPLASSICVCVDYWSTSHPTL